MKKFLFTLAALLMAGNALADSGFFFGTFDEATLGTTNESTLALTQDDLTGEYVLALGAYWSARVSGTEVNITFPEGMTPVFAEPGTDATIETLNARGKTAHETAAFAGLVAPYNHWVTTFSTSGFYYDEDGNLVNQGVNKWEAGFYDEMAIFYFEFAEGFQGGDIIVKTTVASGKDTRGGTVRENGEHTHEFTFICHVTVDGAVPPTPVEKTATPVINVVDNPEEEYVMISAEGDGNVKLYVDGMLVPNPFRYNYQDEENEIVITATAQEDGKEISDEARLEYTVPAKTQEPPTPVVAPVPTFTWDEDTYTMTAACENHDVVLMIGDEVVENPYTVEQTEEVQEITFVAYTVAGEGEDENSAMVEYTVTVPAIVVEPPYETPAPVVTTELTDDALVITATGEGTVTLYVQYINNETGEMTTETYTGEGTVTVPVARGEEEAYINYWAVAQANEDAVPGMTNVEYYVEVPAKEQVTPVDPTEDHNVGYWLVLFDKDGNEIWEQLKNANPEDPNGYQTNVALRYSIYGGHPEMSDDERPNVPFYFVVNGVRYGAETEDMIPNYGDANENPLFENENCWNVPVGRYYVIGVLTNPETGDMYMQISRGIYTELDELMGGKTVAGVRYFNAAGQEMSEANGMTIVVTTYTDGTTEAVKVMK